MEETVRLNKFLSEKGICSRREADRLADEGKVMVWRSGESIRDLIWKSWLN